MTLVNKSTGNPIASTQNQLVNRKVGIKILAAYRKEIGMPRVLNKSLARYFNALATPSDQFVLPAWLISVLPRLTVKK